MRFLVQITKMKKLKYILLLILLTGCTTVKQKEFAFFLAGNCTDLATTKYGLDNGYEEMNPLYPNIESAIVGKIIISSIIFSIAHYNKEHANQAFILSGVLGLSASIWNINIINKNSNYSMKERTLLLFRKLNYFFKLFTIRFPNKQCPINFTFGAIAEPKRGIQN